MNKAVFLDRDGTIVKECNYLGDIKLLRFLPNVKRAIRLLNENNFKVVIVSNQSGIGRGYFHKETVDEIDKEIISRAKNANAIIDAIYYCPHKPEDNCLCRKPKLGLINKAIKELNIDLKKSYMIGDRLSDMVCGINANCKTILVLTGVGSETKLQIAAYKLQIDYIAKNLYDAVMWILNMTADRRRFVAAD